MVVAEFDIVGVRVFPAEADPPLIIYADAVLARAVAGEHLEPVAWRHAQLVESQGRV